MNRPILVLNALLLACLAGLWATDRVLEKRSADRRARDSAFRPLDGRGETAATAVARFDVTLPGAGGSWFYVRRPEGWRIPRHRDAFALGSETEGLLKALFESRGTLIGRMPDDERRFGLDRDHALEAELFDAAGKRLLRAWAGLVAPGQRSSESYATALGSDAILHMNQNPWPYLNWTPGSRLPPLLDGRVIPGALGRGGASRIALSGAGAPAVETLIRREIPFDQRRGFGPDRGPSFEWYGVFAGEGEKRLNDSASWAYSSFVSGLAFDEILGSRAPDDRSFDRPALAVTLDYGGDKKDVLILGAANERALHRLLNATTEQVFLISAEKAKGLAPDVAKLLEKNPEPPAGAPSPLPAPK